MSDLVERVARAIYEEDDPWHKAWPWPDLQSDQAGVDQYRRIAQAAIAAMQTNAAPALKPAVEVWREARQAYNAVPNPYPGAGAEAAAAVIEADRAAIIATKDAEIAALREQLAQQANDNADLPTIAYFAGTADARDRLAALQAHADALAVDARSLKPYLDWTLSAESPGYHPTMPSAVAAFLEALRAYEEFRRE